MLTYRTIGILVCILFSPADRTYGQVYPYDLGFSGLYFNNMVLHDDTIVISGVTFKQAADDQQGIIIVRLDTAGTVIDHFVFYDSLGASYALSMNGKVDGLSVTSDDAGYVLVGTVRGNGIVMKIGNDGTQHWVREYPDPYSRTEVFGKIVDVGNGYLIAGRKQALNYKSDIFIMKVDLDGNKLWEKKYGVDNDVGDYLDDVLVKNRNEIVISGSTSPGNVPIEDKEFINKIFAIDSTGDVKWYWESEPSLDQTVRGLNNTNDGAWTYATIYLDYLSEYQFKGMPKFVIRDSSFNLLSETVLDDADAFNNYLINVIQLADGGFLGTGINWESGTPYNHAYAWMIKMNVEGGIEWERKDRAFPEMEIGSIQYLHSVVELSGGNIIAAGYYDSPSDPQESGILIKVNKDGCIDTLCTTTSLLEQILSKRSQIIIYPNPASDYLTVDVEENLKAVYIELLDMSGRRVLFTHLSPNSPKITLDENISSGIYLLRLFTDSGQFLGYDKVVIQR